MNKNNIETKQSMIYDNNLFNLGPFYQQSMGRWPTMNIE